MIRTTMNIKNPPIIILVQQHSLHKQSSCSSESVNEDSGSRLVYYKTISGSHIFVYDLFSNFGKLTTYG